MSEPLNRHPKSTGRSPFYILLVCSLATFLVGLTIWRAPVVGFTTKAVIVHQSNEQPADNLEYVQEMARTASDELTSEENLRNAISQLPSNENSPLTIESLKSELNVEAKAGDEAGEVVIEIAFTNPSKQLAIAMVDSVAASYVSSHNRNTDQTMMQRGIQDAAEAVAISHQLSLHAKETLEQFLTEHFDDFEQQPIPHPESLVQDHPESNGDGLPSRNDGPAFSVSERTRFESEVNPDWADLQRQIDEIDAYRNELLLNRTETHPEVRGLAEKLGLLKRQRDELPQYLSPAPGAGLNLGPADNRSGSSYGGEADPVSFNEPSDVQQADFEQQTRERAELVQTYRELKQENDLTQQQYQAALENERNAWEQIQTISKDRITVLKPAQVVAERRAAVGSRRLFLLAIPAVFFGLGLSWMGRTKRAERTINDVKEAQTVLPLPVVGTIAASDGSRPPRDGRGRKRLVMFGAWLAEVTLAVFVFAFIFSSAVDGNYGSQFIEDPLGTFAQAVENISSILM